MSIKKFVKEFVKKYFPEAVFLALRRIYRIFMSLVVKLRTSKYLPYYQDELSREILSDRIRYLRTGDINPFIDRAVKEGWTFPGLRYINGIYGTDDKTGYSDVLVVYDKEGRYLDYARKLLTIIYGADGFKCMELEKFLKYCRIFTSSMIVPVVGDKSFPTSIREAEQYFDVFSPADDEVIVDAGAYDGTTAIQFIEWGKGKVKHVYAFEFEPANIRICEDNLRPYADKVTLVKKGTWDREEVMYVKPDGSGTSFAVKGSAEVHLTTIDSVVKDEVVTFIKMDIEGAELKALTGARSTIIKNHPRLAICVYHKPEDLYEIPGYILSLVPEYKFYLRHYSAYDGETVLYAYCG